MTPEQKAFYDFGVAWGGTSVFHVYVRSVLKNRGEKITTELLHHFRDKECSYGMVIREAWKLRRRYRMWAVPLIHRDCHNCAYKNIKPVPVVCSTCLNEGFAINWLPRY